MAVACRTPQEAVDLLRRCLEDGEVKHGRHFREELAKEKLSYEDAWNVLLRGRIFDPPEQDIKTGEWKYRVEGRDAAGRWIAIIGEFLSKMSAVLYFPIFQATAQQVYGFLKRSIGDHHYSW